MEPAGAYPVPVHSARKPRWVAAPPASRLPARRARDDSDRPERRPGIHALDGLRAVAVVLVFGLVNMMRGGSPQTSQKLMRLRVLMQFVAVIVIMITIWAMGR